MFAPNSFEANNDMMGQMEHPTNPPLTQSELTWVNKTISAISSKRSDTFEAQLSAPIGTLPRKVVLDKIIDSPGSSWRIKAALTLINHPGFEKREWNDDGEMLARALTAPMLDILPALHQKGFSLDGSRYERGLLISHISKGRWPFADILLPDILDDDLVNTRDVHQSLFKTHLTLREEFLKQLTRLSSPEGWERRLHISYLYACNDGHLQRIIEEKKMHRGQLVSSLAVLYTRGWLGMDQLEQVIKERPDLSEHAAFARDLLIDASSHELSRATAPVLPSKAPFRRL